MPRKTLRKCRLPTGRPLWRNAPRLSRPPLKFNHSKSLFIDLPVELIVTILENLSDLPTLFSTVQACTRLYNCYEQYEQPILLRILQRECYQVEGYLIGNIYWELKFAIRYDFMAREVVQQLLELAWNLFRERHLEELLIHLVAGLAWTFCIDECESDAVALLKKVWNREHPFSSSLKQKGTVWNRQQASISKIGLPTLVPIGALLAELTNGDEKASVLLDIERLHYQLGKHLPAHMVGILGKKNYVAARDLGREGLATMDVQSFPRRQYGAC